MYAYAVTHGCGDYAGSLACGLALDYLGRARVVLGVEVAYRFVYQKEGEGLAHTADYGHTLLLAYGHLAHREVRARVYAEPVQPLLYAPAVRVTREAGLQLYVLHGGEFGEEVQLLGQVSQSLATQKLPAVRTYGGYVLSVEGYMPQIVATVTVYVGAETGFARAAGGLYHIVLAAPEGDVAAPYLGIGYGLFRKHTGQCVGKRNGVYHRSLCFLHNVYLYICRQLYVSVQTTEKRLTLGRALLRVYSSTGYQTATESATGSS